jgi:hypothetical protein
MGIYNACIPGPHQGRIGLKGLISRVLTERLTGSVDPPIPCGGFAREPVIANLSSPGQGRSRSTRVGGARMESAAFLLRYSDVMEGQMLFVVT